MTASTFAPHASLGSTPWIGVTLGDPSGIGPEVVIKAFLTAPETLEHALVFANEAVLKRAMHFVPGAERLTLVHMRLVRQDKDGSASRPAWRIERTGSEVSRAEHTPVHVLDMAALSEDAKAVFLSHQLNMPEPTVAALGPVGQIEAQSGELAARAIVFGARAALHGLTRALVTAPIHKEALALAGWPYPGHTELLQAECAQFLGTTPEQLPVRMMLKNHELAVVLVSIHISLRQAIERVTFDNVLTTLLITHETLSRSLGRAPRMALSALNPHAGEGGLMGDEEETVLMPVVLKAKSLGLAVEGPFSPDTIYMRARQMRQAHGGQLAPGAPGAPEPFDVVIAMYHDQGLIPVKYLGLDEGVNVTLGLPLVRTSPDHGTAFDIAGTGQAHAASFLEAYKEAKKMIASSTGAEQGLQKLKKAQ